MAEEVNNLDELNLDALSSMDDLDFLQATQDETAEVETTDEVEETEETEETEEVENNDNVDEKEETPSDEVVDENTQETNTSPNDTNDNNVFSFASLLVEEGVLSSLDDIDEKTFGADELVDLVRKEIRSNELAGLSEEQKEVLKRFELGLPVEDFVKNQVELQDLNKVTKDTLESDESLRRSLIVEDFLSKGYSKEKAQKLAQRSFDIGEDVEDSLEALEAKKQVVADTEKQRVATREKELQDMEKQRKATVKKIKETVFDEKVEILPGVPYNKKLAQKTYDLMTTPVTLEDGRQVSAIVAEREKDPIMFEKKLHALFAITDGFKDLSILEGKGKSKAAKEFEEKLGLNTMPKSGSGGVGSSGGSGSENWDVLGNAL